MPTDSDILGFSNRWYKAGIAAKEGRTLPDGTDIYIFPVWYYLAAKVEAVNSRGGKDFRFSHDFEDIIYIFDKQLDIVHTIINSADQLLKDYIRKQCTDLLADNNIREAVDRALPYGSDNLIFKQIMDLFPAGVLKRGISKYNSDKHCSKYFTYDQLASMLFGQLNKCLTNP